MSKKRFIFKATAAALIGAGGIVPGIGLSISEPMIAEAAEENRAPDWTANSVNEVEQEFQAQNAGATNTYQIRWGDTLSALSAATGVSVDKLALQNNIADPDLIYAGDLLYGEGVTDQTTEEPAAQVPSEPEEVQAEETAVEEESTEEPALIPTPAEEIEPMEPTEEEPVAMMVVPEEPAEEVLEESVPEPEEVAAVEVVDVETTEETVEPNDRMVSPQSVAVVTEPDSHLEEPSNTFVRPAQGYVSSQYGYRIHPISGIRRLHGGIDIAGGGAVSAAQGGTVVQVDYNSGWGNYIVIDHGNGLQTLYAHLQNGSITVAEGATVSQGQTIGTMGQTGSATGVHLHFEIYVNGVQVDPAPYL